MKMGLFDLPPEHLRVPSKSILQKLNAELLDWVQEPDFYICYRIGHDLRYVALAFALVALSICTLNQYTGAFENIMDYSGEENLLCLYLYLIDFSGPVFLGAIFLYIIWFKKHISFSQYNILRQEYKSYKNLTELQIWAMPLMASLTIIFAIKPSALAAFVYMDIHSGYFDQYFDSPIFVLLVGAFIVFAHPVVTQAAMKLILMLSYIFYEKSTERKNR